MKAVALLYIITAISAATRFDHVRQYLILHENRKPTSRTSGTNWLENSNTIGLGYNPLLGNPVCYSGTCQSDGFRRSVFKLIFTQPTLGSCTSKLIPNNVELYCIPSSDLRTSTEIISTLNQLSQSTSHGISFGADVQYKMFSAGYSHSKETRFMIDQMTKNERTSIFTTGKYTYGKLSVFEPFMELSDNFRYVIEKMPCCQYDNILDEYIQEFIINHFGFTFVTELTLGGIAQQTFFMDNTEIKQMQQDRQDISNSASIGFLLTFNMKVTSSYDQTKQEHFMRSAKNVHATKLGGDPSIQNIDEWIKSVPTNPVITHIAVKGIVHLLTDERFPNDPLIRNKSQLVDMAIKRYLNKETPFCYNNCTDLEHGECDSSHSYFLFGICKCQPGWTGIDCSEKKEHKTYLITPEGGPWGEEKDWVYCPQNTWAIGFRQRVEAPCGKCDDTALNALELVCGTANGVPVENIKSYDGLWGSWNDPTLCDGERNFLRGVQLRIEPRQGKGDDTSTNDSRFTCTNGNVIQASNGAPWGDWKSAADCPPLTAICGFQIRFEQSQGKGDDTAMNGAKFMCCPT